MRHITKNFLIPPAELLPNTGAAPLVVNNAVASLNSMLANGGHKQRIPTTGGGRVRIIDMIQPAVYQSVRDTLRNLYHKKCAYCEAVEWGPEVEHYRPARKVTRERGHPGYYWLVYEWSNLVPSCHDCNKVSGGKGNKFPVRGTRVSAPPATAYADRNVYRADFPPLANEQPYLLHPEIDRPEPCLKILPDGRLEGTDAATRGEKTITICNLNRDNLCIARKSLTEGWVKEIRRALDRCTTALSHDPAFARTQLYRDLELVFSDIREGATPTLPYSFVAWHVYQHITHFQDIISAQLPTLDRTVVEQAFAAYITANPL